MRCLRGRGGVGRIIRTGSNDRVRKFYFPLSWRISPRFCNDPRVWSLGLRVAAVFWQKFATALKRTRELAADEQFAPGNPAFSGQDVDERDSEVVVAKANRFQF